MINYNVPINLRGNNSNIKASLSVTNETMKANGFRQHNGKWYLMKNLGHDISLNISILCDVVAIDILDESFLQPYDYQRYLRNNPDHEFALSIHHKVQAIMKQLSDSGIISGYVANDYI